MPGRMWCQGMWTTSTQERAQGLRETFWSLTLRLTLRDAHGGVHIAKQHGDGRQVEEEKVREEVGELEGQVEEGGALQLRR